MSNRVRISRARPVTIAPLLGLALGFVPSVLGAPLLGPAGASWAPVQTIDHIQIVTDLESLPSEYWHPSLGSETNPLIQELRPLDQTTRNPLRIALDRLPAALHGSISKLSIAVYGGEGVAGDAYGNNRGGPRNSDRLLRWDPDQEEGVWNATEETELSC